MTAGIDARTGLGLLFDQLSRGNVHLAETEAFELRITDWLSETFHKFHFTDREAGGGFRLFDRNDNAARTANTPLDVAWATINEREDAIKAIRFHDYGPSSILRYEEVSAPRPGEGEVLLRVAATSVNPIDFKIRSGAVRDRMPVELPYVPGVDVAGTVEALGPGVSRLAVGDRVMGMSHGTYAQLCVARVDTLAIVPDGMELEDAATLPLVTMTGDQLVRLSTKARAGQTILVTGALGAVGRSAVFAANSLGCRVVAGVRGRQADDAAALSGVDAVVSIDDEAAITTMATVDCVADTVGGDVAARTIKRVRDGGIFGTAVRGPYARDGVEVNAVFAKADPDAIRRYAEAVRDGRLAIPRGLTFPLARAAEAQDAAEAGGTGKIVLKP